MTDTGTHPDIKIFRQIQNRLESRLTPESDTWIRVCDSTIRLRFAEQTMKEPLIRAVAHFQCGPVEDTDLTILVGDATVCPLPERPYPATAFGRRSELATSPESGIVASYMMGPDILSMLNQNTATAVYWTRDGDAVPGFEQAAPFRHILHWYLRDRGWMLIHGAAIGRNGKGVLICGKGGSGKSTLAVATWHAPGWQFAGDDYCAVSMHAPHRVFPIYSTAKLNRGSAAMLTIELDDTSPREGDKVILMANDHIPAFVPDVLELTAILIPVRSSGPASSRPTSRASAARQLIVSTLYQMPHAGERDHRSLTDLILQIPPWEIAVPEGSPRDALRSIRRVLESSERMNP